MKAKDIDMMIMAITKEYHTWQQGLQSRKATMSNQEQLMKVKIKYLEDRLTTMEKSLSALNKVVGGLQAVEYERDLNQGFKDIGKEHELI